MKDSRTFRKGEVVIIYYGGKSRSSVELAKIGEDVWYGSDTVLVTYGHFNVKTSKSSVHKLPATLKKALKQTSIKDGGGK